MQDSLLDLGDEPKPETVRPERVQLDHRAWVDVQRGWLAGSAALFARLFEQVPWRAERRQMYDRTVDVPRLQRFYGEDAELPDPALVACRDTLNGHYEAELGEPFRTAGLCLYRDGRDSVAWHGDTVGRGRTEDTMVAIVSLGTARAELQADPRACGARRLRHGVLPGPLAAAAHDEQVPVAEGVAQGRAAVRGPARAGARAEQQRPRSAQ